MKIKYLFPILFCLLFSCKENAIGDYASVDYYFIESQPVNDKELHKIPKRFIGNYNFEDDNTLYVTEKEIYFQYSQNVVLPLSEKDSIFKQPGYKAGKWISYNPYTELYIDAIKDSVYLSGFTRDSIFTLSANSIAKRYRGNLILSIKDSIFWKVNILSVNKDTLYWKHLSLDDYKEVKEITKEVTINNDTTKIILKPTKKEFKQLIDMEMSWSRAYKKEKAKL